MPTGEIPPHDFPRVFGLSASAYAEFSDLCDFIWKTPQFLQDQKRIELEKLETYFPAARAKVDPIVAKLRLARSTWELGKINGLFPYTIAVGNLFSASALFESYIMALVRELEPSAAQKFSTIKGNGFARAMAFLKANGYFPSKTKLYQQVDSILCIRNAIYHASGFLEWSRDRDKIETIIREQIYLSPLLKSYRRKKNLIYLEAEIVDSKLGRRIVIKNDFSLYAASIYRDYFSFLYLDTQLDQASSSEQAEATEPDQETTQLPG